MSSKSENHALAGDGSAHSNGRGMLMVVSSPSGGGKGTLIRRVLKIVPDVRYSVSYTTRAPRKDEVPGKDYFFVSAEEFRAMASAGEFLEWAVVHDNLYGTTRAQVEHELSQGYDIILEIDVQGAENVSHLIKDAVMVFVLPPSFEILCKRLTFRGSEQPDDLALRLRNACHEVKAYQQFDYIIINEDADRAGSQLAAIIYSERARRTRQEHAAQQVLDTFTASAKCD